MLSGHEKQTEYCTFNYEEPLENLPEKTTFHYIDQRHLIIAPDIPSWLVLSDVEYDVYKILKEKEPILSIFEPICAKYGLSLQECDHHIQLLLQQILDKDFWQDKVSEEINLPLRSVYGRVVLHVTNRCNLKCKQCYMDSGKALDHELCFEEWICLIDAISEWNPHGQIIFSGGEPLLHPEILELVTYAYAKNNRTMLITNGTMFKNPGMLEDLLRVLDSIQISIDGTSAEIHDAIRGEGSFVKSMETISYLKGLGRKFNLSMCVIPENIQDLKENIVSFIQEINPEYIDVLGIDPVTFKGRAKHLRDYFSDAEGESAAVHIKNLLRKNGIRFQDFKLCIPGNNFANCSAGIVAEIHANGDVGFCHFTKKFGNIREQSFSVIMPQIEMFQEQTSVKNLLPCRDCDLKYICKGGCKADFMLYNNDPTQVICHESIKQVYYSKLVSQ